MRAGTPPMGWNSWDCYGPSVTEAAVRRNAEIMASELKPYGWQYVVVDIQWYEPGARSFAYRPDAPVCMDEYSRLVPAENRFPSASGGKGFKPLADYVHSLGLKFGIHILRGIPRRAVRENTAILGTDFRARDIARTDSVCTWNTDMYGVDASHPAAAAYYDSLFALYASWGVDFIKCDDICREVPREEAELRLLSSRLYACGRPIVLSLSPGPAKLEYAGLYRQTANMWRLTDDFWDTWPQLYEMFARAAEWIPYSSMGHWPDGDMLPLGALRLNEEENGWTRFTPDEQRTMLTLWCIARFPLMLGAELTRLDEQTRALITNEDVLAMLRDGRRPRQVLRRKSAKTEFCFWRARCCNGGTYAAIFNLGEGLLTVSAAALGAEQCPELWTQQLADTFTLAPHACAAYYINR